MPAGRPGRCLHSALALLPCSASYPSNPPGHNCLKAELLVTDRSWPQREAFLAALRAKLASLPNRVAYYPGGCCRSLCNPSRSAPFSRQPCLFTRLRLWHLNGVLALVPLQARTPSTLPSFHGSVTRSS